MAFTRGYYAQLDDTSRNFYNQPKAAFVSPAVSATITVNHAFTNCTGTGTTVDGGTQISLSQESREEINTWLQENLTTAYLALERDHPEMPWLKTESFGFGGESGYSIGIEKAAEENGTYTFTATVNNSPFVLTGVPAEVSDTSAFTDAIATATGAIDANISGNNSRYATVRAVHDYLCDL